MVKSKSKPIVGGVILFAILIGLIYGIFGWGYGISISCDGSINELKRVPPPLMSIIPPPTECFIDLEVTLEDTVLCSYEKFEVMGKNAIVNCNELKKHKDNNFVFISAIFYDLEGNEIGRDVKHPTNLPN